MRRSVAECTIPATGVRPPFCTLVAVRAIAPVAGIPPNRGATMFATHCATSSMFERWRPPVMQSATTAERSGQIPPSRAIVNTGARTPRGRRAQAEAEEVFHLTREDDERDAPRETDRDRIGDELDRATQAPAPDDDQNHDRHHRRRREPLDAVTLHDGVHDHHERSRGSAD